MQFCWKYSVASAFSAAISYFLPAPVPVYISANSAEQLGLAWSVQADSAKLYSLSCQNVTAKGCVCTGALDAKCLRHAGAFTKGEVHFCCHQSNSLVYFDDQAIAR